MAKTEEELDALMMELSEIILLLDEKDRYEILQPLREKFKELENKYPTTYH